MKQPTYSPQEALERVKLMMGYDMSKTLTENRKIIQEQSTTQVGLATAGGLAASSAAGAGTAAALATSLGAAGSAVPIVGTAAGIVIGYGLGTLIDWAANHDLGESGFRQVMKACSAKGVDKLVPKLSKADVRNIAYTIEDAKGQWNDDEDAIEQALREIPTIADLCAVNKKIPGGLSNFLDDLTDSPDEWKRFTRPLAAMIEDTEIVLTPEETDCAKNPNQEKCKKTLTDEEKIRRAKACGHKTWEAYKASGWKCKKGGGGGGSSFKQCKGTYTYLCMADAIKTVQACLGLTADGKWGNKTQSKLKSLGYSSFTDADVQKICGKKTDVEGETIDVSGEDKKISTSDTNF
jgi:hypothetical protein